jgi:hypothetical protein
MAVMFKTGMENFENILHRNANVTPVLFQAEEPVGALSGVGSLKWCQCQ